MLAGIYGCWCSGGAWRSVLGNGRGRKEQARRGWKVGSPLCLAAKSMCVCSWALCFSSCLLSMSQTLAPWRVAPQTAGLPRPGDPPEIPAPPEPCGIMLQASNGRERWGGACSVCGQYRGDFLAQGGHSVPRAGAAAQPLSKLVDEQSSGHSTGT